MPEQDNDRISYLEARLSAIETQAGRTDLMHEAFGIVHGILTDLISDLDIDVSEYEEDLDRLEQLKQLML